MKKTILATLLAFSTAAAIAAQPDNAPNGPQAGFQDPNQPVAAQKQDPRQAKQQDRKDRREQNTDRREQSHPHRYHAQACHADMRAAMPMMMFGGERHPSGFMQSKQVTTVADANNWKDDQVIVLEGKIVKQVGKNDFVFKDNSGEIELEIDRQAWKGLVTPEDTVRVIADVEKSWGKTEVEAHHVFKAKAAKPAATNEAQAAKAGEEAAAPAPQQ